MNNILKYFFEEPERQLHIRELSRITKKSPASISKYLNELKKEKILLSEKKFNHIFYKANTEFPLFKTRKLSYNLEQLHTSGLIEYLQDQYNHPQAIILFGSYAKAENNLKSDIDIVIITPLKKQVKTEQFEKKLGHSIQLFIHSHDEIKLMATKNKELLNNFINGIILQGYLEIFT